MAMKRKHKRLTFVLVALALIGLAVGLVLNALSEGVSLFKSPTDLVTSPPPATQSVRLGGLVEEESVRRTEGSAIVRFRVTDVENSVEVVYEGLLPDLFREGQGIVTLGKMVDGTFQADEVLAKHDENYMPAEAVDALKKSGQWKGDEEGAN